MTSNKSGSANGTTKDFYLHERALAGYVEKDWSDVLIQQGQRFPNEFARFDRGELYSDYHERIVDFLIRVGGDLSPLSLLEVGSSLGRTYYENCRSFASLRSATLIEPSENLSSTFKGIFFGSERAKLPVLKGLSDVAEVDLNTSEVRKACAHVDARLIAKPFAEVDLEAKKFDLVICSNVIDQCREPLRLVDFLKSHVAQNGILLLSCTYQWNAKYIGNASSLIRDITSLFEARWAFLGETNLPFRVRSNERYWMTFLSHVVAYRP